MKKEKKKKRIDRGTVLLAIAFFAGLFFLLYPSVSNYWNSKHQARAIATYTDELNNINEELYEELWNKAVEYNEHIPERNNPYVQTKHEKEIYPEMLSVGLSGVIGYIQIPKLDVIMPIYHGTSDGVLQSAIGHVEWTSLPVGGKNTHCVLSGHRGLPSARLFTDLDELVEGDIFMLRVLDEVLTYEVDQILIVKPEDSEALKIIEGGDYCTLVTCTPYGINTHRLLVRGHRVENRLDGFDIRITADAIRVEPLVVAPILSIPLVLIFVTLIMSDEKRRRLYFETEEDDEKIDLKEIDLSEVELKVKRNS